jgi:DNA replicative helicase MCM subunit Mcm2 (Cdc46/Mcm family)
MQQESKEIKTKSAIIDDIASEFRSDKNFDNLIYNLQFQKATLTINPIKYPTLLEVCATDPDNVKDYIKNAVKKMLEDYGVKTQGIKFVMENFDSKIVFDDVIPLEKLTAEYENKIIQTIGQIVSIGRVESYLKESMFECKKCQNMIMSKFVELQCPDCKQEMIAIQSFFGDTVFAEIHPPYDGQTSSQQIQYTAQFFDDEVFSLRLGDIKKLTVIRKSVIKKNKDTRKIILRVLTSTDVASKEPKLPDDSLKKRLHALAERSKYLEILTNSIAPTILFNELAKLGVLLTIIGGTPQESERGKLHMLICGDPSEAKTTLIKYFTSLPFQKTGYAVGGQATGQTITIAMSKFTDGTSFPSIGIIPLCDDGYVGLDEFNLMSEEDHDKVREVMTDGEIHYNKGGHNLRVRANTTIIAGLNPKWHVYDFEKSMRDNLGLALPILSRFDIKINITSSKDIEREGKIITHIMNVKSDGVSKLIESLNLLTIEELSLLINYAKTFRPIAPDNVREKLIKYYLQQKQLEFSDSDFNKRHIDRRTGKSLLVLAEAFAKLHFSDTVTEYHADLAIDFAKKCVKTFGYDPEQGLVQQTMVEAQYTPTQAFEYVCELLQVKNDDKMFSEQEVTNEILEKFPTLFKRDYEVHLLWKKYENTGRFTYRNGRYQLV